MSNEYTNKQIIFTFREELLRRKELAYGLKDYIKYDDSKYLVMCGWDNNYINSQGLYLMFEKKEKKLLNIFWDTLEIVYTPKNGWRIGNALKKESLTEYLPIIDEKGLNDYLIFLYEELRKDLMLDETKKLYGSYGSDFVLNSNQFTIGYNAYNDLLSIINLDDKKNIDLNLLKNYLEQTQNSELFPEYIIESLEKNADKNIIFDENKENIRKEQILYKIEDKNNSLILKRKMFNR